MNEPIREGEPMIFIPVLQSAADYDGRPIPLGYVRVEEVRVCPICVETQTQGETR